MTGFWPWRDLRSVMVLTLHVAVVASVVRLVTGPTDLGGSFLWVAVSMAVVMFLSWPISRGIASAFDPGSIPFDRRCPRCNRSDLRPLLRMGAGLFQPISGYRCAACWTTFRLVGGSTVEEGAAPPGLTFDSSGIEFVDQVATESEIRFLDDDGPDSPASTGPAREHPPASRVDQGPDDE